MVRRRRRSKKWISWLVILILVVVAGVVCYMVWDSYLKEDKQETNVETEQTEEIKTEETDIEIIDDEESGIKVKQYEGEDPNKAAELSGVVTYAGVVDGVLMIRVNIDQFLESGECALTLEKNGANIYSSAARIIENVSTATCEGFDVPASELGGGNIKININLSANGKTGTIRGEANL